MMVMARLRDVPMVLQRVGAWTFVKNVYQKINDDSLLTWASALAYSWLFAVFPFFLILMTLLPYLPDEWKTGATRQLEYAVAQLPQEAASTVWNNVSPKINQLLYDPPRGLFSISVILTIWAASGGMNVTMSALDKCYEVQKPRSFHKQRSLAILLTVIVATLIVLVLVLLPIGTVVTHVTQKYLADRSLDKYLPLIYLWQVLRYVLGLLLMFTVLACIYYFGPNFKHKWQFLSPGAVFSIAVWIILGIGFRLYINKFGKYNETYGTIGGVAILLFCFYVDAVVLLVGAEINSALDRGLGQPAHLPEATT